MGGQPAEQHRETLPRSTDSLELVPRRPLCVPPRGTCLSPRLTPRRLELEVPPFSSKPLLYRLFDFFLHAPLHVLLDNLHLLPRVFEFTVELRLVCHAQLLELAYAPC